MRLTLLYITVMRIILKQNINNLIDFIDFGMKYDLDRFHTLKNAGLF